MVEQQAIRKRLSQRAATSLFAAAFADLLIAVIVGFVMLAAARSTRPTTRILLGWDLGVALYLVLIRFTMVGAATIDRIRRRAAEEDEGAFAILFLTHGGDLREPGRDRLRARRRQAGVATRLRSSPSCRPGRRSCCRGPSFTRSSPCITRTNITASVATARRRAEISRRTTSRTIGTSCISRFVIGMTSQVSDVAITSKSDPPHRRDSRRALVLLQRLGARADREHRLERRFDPRLCTRTRLRPSARSTFAASDLTMTAISRPCC